MASIPGAASLTKVLQSSGPVAKLSVVLGVLIARPTGLGCLFVNNKSFDNIYMTRSEPPELSAKTPEVQKSHGNESQLSEPIRLEKQVSFHSRVTIASEIPNMTLRARAT